jgi:uncharacterized protein
MSVDLLLPAGEKIVVVLEAIGDGKLRLNSMSLDYPLTILPDQGIEISWWGASLARPTG